MWALQHRKSAGVGRSSFQPMSQNQHQEVLGIIPARGGSKDLPRKNVRLLAGKPLIVYSIEAAKQCPLIDRVIVSTEDPEIAQIAKKAGAEVPFMRPMELADDHATTVQVLRHAIDWLEENERYTADIVVFFQPTDVFRTRALVRVVVSRLMSDDQLDTVFCGYLEHKNYWHKVNGKYARLDHREQLPRQIKEPIFREDTGLACATRPHVIRSGRRIGDRVDIVVTSDTATCIDIHTPYDLFLAEKTLSEWGKKVNE